MREVRRGPLTWGQQLIWLFDRMASASGNALVVSFHELAIPVPTDVDGVLAAVDALVARHEALRTTFVADRLGTAVQVVHEFDRRRYEHQVVTAETGGRDDWLGRRFDLSVDWPVRVQVLVEAGRPASIRLAVHRLVADHHATEALLGDLHELLDAAGRGRPPDLPASVWHPLDIADLEASPAGSRESRRALEYWERGLAVVPNSPFPRARAQAPGDGRFSVQLSSRRCRLAVAELAAALRVTEPTVLTAVSALALVVATGSPECAMAFVAPNRNQRGMRASLGAVADRALLTEILDTGSGFHTLVRQIDAATLRGHRHSHYHPDGLHRLIAETMVRRGIFMHRLPRLNILPASALAGSDGHDAGEGPESFDTTTSPAPLDGVSLIIEISARSLGVNLRAGEHILPVAEGESLVRTWERLLLSARDRPEAAVSDLVPVTPVEMPAGTIVDHCRVDVAAVAEALRGLDGVDHAAVFVDGEPAGLVAFVVTRQPELTPAALRAALFPLLGTHSGLMCPHEFVVCRRPPDDPTDYHAWRRVEPVHRGAGWPREFRSPGTEEERCLVAAFARIHPDVLPESVDVGSSYLGAGGRLERIPAFLGRLAELSYQGIRADDLLGWYSIEALARRLGPVPAMAGQVKEGAM